jgi:hypothetical protein
MLILLTYRTQLGSPHARSTPEDRCVICEGLVQKGCSSTFINLCGTSTIDGNSIETSFKGTIRDKIHIIRVIQYLE